MAYNKQKPRKNFIPEPRINDEIVGYETVRLVYKKFDDKASEEDFAKVVSLADARKLSQEYLLDLIEINAKSVPPVVRLGDYSKYLWNLKKQIKAKSKQVNTLKEVQLSTNISEHDMDTKVNKAVEFVNDGFKVKVVLTMRGRELGRREESKKSFYQFLDKMSAVVVIAYDSAPKDEGNKCIAIVRKK